MKTRKFHPAILLLGPLVVSVELVFLKWAFRSRGLDPVSYTANRTVIAALVLLPLLWKGFQGELKKNGRAILLWCLLLGVLRAAADLLYFVSQKYTTATNVALLSQLGVVVTGVLAYLLLKERMSAGEIVSGAAMLAGAVFVTMAGGALAVRLGDLLVLLYVLAVSLSNIGAKAAFSKGIGKGAALFGSLLFSAAILGLAEPLLLRVMPANHFFAQIPYTVPGALLALASLGLIYFYIDNFGPTRAVIAYIATAIFAPLMAAILLGEKLQASQLAGGAVIAGGAFFFVRASQAAGATERKGAE